MLTLSLTFKGLTLDLVLIRYLFRLFFIEFAVLDKPYNRALTAGLCMEGLIPALTRLVAHLAWCYASLGYETGDDVLCRFRPARLSDLPAAAQLWFDRMTLLQQTEAGIKLLPDAREKWSTVAAEWTGDEQVSFLAAEQDGVLIGFTVVRLAAGKPGLQPQRRGILLAMAVTCIRLIAA